MAAYLADSDIQDLVTGTQQHLGRMKFNQIAQRLQRYEVMGRILKKDRVGFSSGYGIRRTLMIDHSAAAHMVALYESDVVNVSDVLITMEVPWRHVTTNYAFERREIAYNTGAERIVDLMKVRRANAMISLAELLEDQFWGLPSTTTSNDIYGVPYWVVRDVGNASGAFVAENHPRFTSGRGGVDSTTYTRWANWSNIYTSVSKSDLITAMRRGARQTGFESPVDIADFRRGRGQTKRVYCNEETINAFELVGESQNENLGRDIAAFDGTITFRRNPIVWVPQLDSDTDDPIYCLDLSYMNPVFLQGDYLRETPPMKAPNQHNVSVVHVDLTMNLLCTDLRRQAVYSKTEANFKSA